MIFADDGSATDSVDEAALQLAEMVERDAAFASRTSASTAIVTGTSSSTSSSK
jgi:hypothetical protein